MKTIVLASNNEGKLAEFNQVLTTYPIDVVPQKKFDISDAEETGTTFIENAIIKARHATQHAHLPAIADDSGLVIDALNGAPGIYSARYAGNHGDATANYERVLQKLQNVPQSQRQAHFHCTLVYMTSATDPEPIVVSAQWHGFILTEPYGTQGFGYDPIFFVPNYNCSAAELDSDIKNQISHRAQAIRLLLAQLAPLINETRQK